MLRTAATDEEESEFVCRFYRRPLVLAGRGQINNSVFVLTPSTEPPVGWDQRRQHSEALWDTHWAVTSHQPPGRWSWEKLWGRFTMTMRSDETVKALFCISRTELWRPVAPQGSLNWSCLSTDRTETENHLFISSVCWQLSDICRQLLAQRRLSLSTDRLSEVRSTHH